MKQKNDESKFSINKQTSLHITKDIFLVIIGFLLGKYLTNFSLIPLILILIPLMVILYIILGELLENPVFKWYNTKLIFNKKDFETIWGKLEQLEFKDQWDNLINADKNTSFTLTKLDEEKTIIIGSKTKIWNDLIKKQIVLYNKPLDIQEEICSVIQVYINKVSGINLPKNGKYPFSSRNEIEFSKVTKLNYNIVASKKQLNEIYEIFETQIKSLKEFKENHNIKSKDLDKHNYFEYKKGEVFSDIYLSKLGSEFLIFWTYHEKEGVHKNSDNKVIELKNLNNLLVSKIDYVLEHIKKNNIDCNPKIYSVAIRKYKFEQHKIIRINTQKSLSRLEAY